MRVAMYDCGGGQVVLIAGSGGIICSEDELRAVVVAIATPLSARKLDWILEQANCSGMPLAYEIGKPGLEGGKKDGLEIRHLAMKLGDDIFLWKLNIGPPTYGLGSRQGFFVLSFEQLRELARVLPDTLDAFDRIVSDEG